MKRYTTLVLLLTIAALGAATRIDFEAWGPAKLRRGSGMVETRGVTANTDAARGAVLKTLWTSATAGDQVELNGNATSDFSPQKNGVRLNRAPNATYTNTGNLPAIDISDLSTGNGIVYRGREAKLYEPDPEFCLWSFGFETSNNYANTVFSTSGPTLTIANGSGTYVSAGGTSSASLLGAPRPQVAQFTCAVLIGSHNASAGATYNDVMVGFGRTSTSTGDTLQYTNCAVYRRTESKNQIFLHYDYSGGPVETTPVEITETQPFYLVYVQNHNSATAAIIRSDGTWRIVDHQEITLAHVDCEDLATVQKMRPMIYFQSNGPQTTVIRDWWVRAMGTLGEREHMVCRYENGEPIKNKDGYVYVSVDDIGPNTASTATNGPNTAYMRCTHGVYLLDPKTGRRVKTTAKFYQQVSGRTFGTQEGFILHDRNTGLWHVWFSEWNYSGGSAAKIYHAASYQSPLEAGMKVYPVGELTQNTALLGVVGTGGAAALYSTNVRLIDGTWYMSGIAAGFGSSPGRRVYLVSDDNPDFSSPTLVWRNDTDVVEGGYLWHVGSNWYVSAGVGDHVEAWDLLTGADAYTHAFPGAGRYDPFMDLLEYVDGGNTKYMFLTFSDTPAGPHGEDFYDGTAYNPVAFGSRLLIDGGTFSGEQYTETAR